MDELEHVCPVDGFGCEECLEGQCDKMDDGFDQMRAAAANGLTKPLFSDESTLHPDGQVR